MMEEMSIQFPKEPMECGRYFDVPNRPQVAQRWVMYTYNSHPMQAFYRGNCLYCGCSTWSLADGTTTENMGQHGLRPVYDPDDDTEYVACNNCGASEGQAEFIVTQGREAKRLGSPFSPIEWPAKHPMHKMASL